MHSGKQCFVLLQSKSSNIILSFRTFIDLLTLLHLTHLQGKTQIGYMRHKTIVRELCWVDSSLFLCRSDHSSAVGQQLQNEANTNWTVDDPTKF